MRHSAKEIRWALSRAVRAAAGLLALSCCALPASAAGELPVEINVVISQTGGGAFLGAKTTQALGVLEQVVNRSGGVAGRPVKFTFSDDGSNPQTAIQLLNGLIAKKTSLVIGSSIVATCAAMIPLLQNGPLTYCLATPVQGPNGSFMFTQGTDAAAYAPAELKYLRSRHLTRVAVITSTDASGQAFQHDFDAFMATPDAAGITVVDSERFNNSDLSMTAQVERIKAKAPQAILTFAIGPAFGTLLHNLSESGLDVPTVGSAGNLSTAQLVPYKAFAPKELLFLANGGAAPLSNVPAGVRAAQTVYFKAFADAGIAPEVLHSISWDAAMLYVDALRKLGPNAGAEQIRQYLAGLRGWSGMFGVYDFPKFPQRGVGPDALHIFRWDAGTSKVTTVI